MGCDFFEINRLWQAALRAHACEPLVGERGPYRPIGEKSLRLLAALWERVPQDALPDLGAMLAAGKDVRFFGDPHFEHENIIRLCDRGFASVGEMDAQLTENVERSLDEADFVLCLGDLAIKNGIAHQRRLFGARKEKALTLVGNHDAKGAIAAQWAQAGAAASLAFALPRDLLRAWVGGREPEMSDLLEWESLPEEILCGCSHWPVPPSRFPAEGVWINIHGHTHNMDGLPLRLNFSVETIGFQPARLQEKITAQLIDDLIRNREGKLLTPAFDESSDGY